MNPPYAQSKSDAELHELYFVKEMLDMLEKGGIGVAIIPLSSAKSEIIKYHTLKAVMSMPEDLFYPVGTVTCIVIFEAHKPHMQSEIHDPITGKITPKKAFKKTWFGFWKDDGFVKTKQMGRTDLYDRWPAIKERWLEAYLNNEVHPGESVTAYVTDEDEWLAEAYLETDYSDLKESDFEKVVRDFAIFKLTNRFEDQK